MKENMEKCCICNSDIDEEEGGVVVYFCMIPTSFCVWCLSSVTDMVIQMHGFDDIDILQERIDELKDER